jgi:predicted neutral ceramidase superfamily lipid hydrolase
MDGKKRLAAPDFASVMFIGMATLLSILGILGVIFMDLRFCSELLELFSALPLVLWFVALTCFKFPTSGTIAYWFPLCLAAFGLFSGTQTGEIWSDTNYVFGRLLYFIFSGVLLTLNVANVFLRSENQER